jgi:hypothetical protein
MTSTGPNFLIIGAARSATTAVARALAQRADVFLTSPKEPHFFAFAEQEVHFSGPGDQEMMNNAVVSDPDAYLRLYDQRATESLWGDGSVSTLYYSDRAINTIRTYADPDVKLLCLLREPARRAHSAFLYLRSRGYEPLEHFTEALAEEEARIAAGYHHMWHYRRMSHYAPQVRSFSSAFGARLFIGITEELQADPKAFNDNLCDFLEIPHDPTLDLSMEVNRGGEPKSRLLARSMSTLRKQPLLRRAVNATVPSRLREQIRKANLREAATDHALDERFRWQFLDDVRAVEDLLGRPIPTWRHELHEPRR